MKAALALAVVAILSIAVIALAPAASSSEERARVPVVGDVWTVDVHRWKQVPAGTSLLRYGRVQVTGLAGPDGLELHACDSTADEIETIEDGCTAFPIALAPVARADVLPMVRDGRIVAIGSGSGGHPWRVVGYAGLALVALGAGATGLARARAGAAARRPGAG